MPVVGVNAEQIESKRFPGKRNVTGPNSVF
jgi:hypothetical protein